MRRVLALSNSLPALPPSPSESPKPPIPCNFAPIHNNSSNFAKKTLIAALSGALSIGFVLSSPSSIALESPTIQSPSESCREDERALKVETAPEVMTNVGIVEEAWEIVNDSFLDTGRHRWSPQTWLRKKDDILNTTIPTRSKAHDIIRRMLASLGDPYTRFLSPEEFSKMARYDMSGIGLNLREILEDDGGVKLKVLGLLLDGPAHSAGVRQGDEVLAVNGVDVRGKSAFEVSSLLQGPNETFVTVKVKHGDCGPIQSIEVQRQLVARTPVFYRLEQIDDGTTSVGYVRLKEFNALAKKDLGDEVLAVNGVDVRGKSAFEVSSLLQGPNETFVTVKVKHGDCGPIQSIEVQRQLVARTPVFYRLEQIDDGTTSVGYVRLKEFNALAKKDLVTAMKRLQDMGASYFILDLRDNLGGLVQDTAGIEIAKLFLNEGDRVIYTVGRDLQYQNTIVADTAPLIRAPVIVLVNNKTASASEIVASSLHDNCRAVLVGEKTFGKGLIQSVFELHDGSGVVVTVGKYVTPNHKDINGNGIEPDYRNFPGWSDVRQRLSQCSKLHQG
ncbi:Carboxyl-terminal-processing protease [Morella rubra]|uniref:C-terminal processing peptidase n=1 Tax=Morella rubra TaxID=262757 RepID=A0A6A1W873_9ROSI|nr:Carboxyl-terminal-processing protease [Morella rubra]